MDIRIRKHNEITKPDVRCNFRVNIKKKEGGGEGGEEVRGKRDEK